MKNYISFYVTYTEIRQDLISKLSGMRARCEYEKGKAYKYYGAKGIAVCDLWRENPEAFIGWSLENEYTPGKHIHRLNPHGDYEP